MFLYTFELLPNTFLPKLLVNSTRLHSSNSLIGGQPAVDSDLLGYCRKPTSTNEHPSPTLKYTLNFQVYTAYPRISGQAAGTLRTLVDTHKTMAAKFPKLTKELPPVKWEVTIPKSSSYTDT